MKSKAHASGFVSSGRTYDQEARLLVQLLRTSHLALLYGDDGSDKTALLRLGLMPILSRRTSDKLVPTASRSSGVVVPFPERRGRSSNRATKRRRELVVYFDDWTDTPLLALREALHLATGTAPAEQLAPSMRLSEILEDLSRRLDTHLVVLLDRFEELLQSSQGPARAQFTNELAEAVNMAELPASFLIAVDEAARPGLASLRARIPGFDDFSLKVAPPRDFKPLAAPQVVKPAEPDQPMAPVAIEELPVLTEPVELPSAVARSVVPAAAEAMVPVPRARKVKIPPLPRVQVKTEDVYAMIEEALSRIAARTADDRRPSPLPHGSIDSQGSVSRARTHAKDLEEAINRMEQRLGTRDGLRPDS